MSARRTLSAVLVPLTIGGFLVAVSVARFRTPERGDLADLPLATPQSELTVLHAQPFSLDEPYVHWWRAEQPDVSSGWLMVLDTNPTNLVRRQSYESVLYVGDETAERLNNGDVSGRVVVLVPAALDAAGEPREALEDLVVFFGDPALPEQIDREACRAQLRAAEAASIQPVSRGVAQRAGSNTGGTLYLANRQELEQFAADLIDTHSPAEADVARGMRVR